MDNIRKTLTDTIDILRDRIIPFRKRIHEFPELSHLEAETRDFIISNIPQKEYIKIVKFEGAPEGDEPARNDMTYGFWVDVILDAREPGRDVIAFRADIDALPVEEETGLEFASKKHGVMHACGHDTHVAMVFGALLSAVENHDILKKSVKCGCLRFIFQAAEESSPGGASVLVKKGVLNGVKHVFGLHMMPNVRSGEVAFGRGGVMAAVREFEIEFLGRGGHAAKPDQSTDLILMASELIVSAQKIISRFRNPLKPGVLSFCVINAGTARNVLPAKLILQGTIRSLDDETKTLLPEKLEKLIKNKCEEFGAAYSIKWIEGYPVTFNDDRAVTVFARAAEKVFAEDKVHMEAERSMGAEDFSYYAEKVPSAFAFLGCGDISDKGENRSFPLHHPKFCPGESDMIGGAKLLCSVIAEFAEPKGK